MNCRLLCNNIKCEYISKTYKRNYRFGLTRYRVEHIIREVAVRFSQLCCISAFVYRGLHHETEVVSTMQAKIQVLLSAYNGEKYILEQLESIQQQKEVELSILIRDDESTDKTVTLLKDYAAVHANVQFYTGKNVGASASFFDLVEKADKKNEFFAFADQDDIWLPDKLSRALQCLSQEKEQAQPLLYASQVQYANADLSLINASLYQREKKPAFGNALVENICMGCTEVFNRQLLECVASHRPQSSIMHDWWFYLTASCFGTVYYDKESYILYRQHETNEVGMQENWRKRWKHRLKQFKKRKGTLQEQAVDFLQQYGSAIPEYEKVLQLATYKDSLKQRMELIKNREVYRQERLDNQVYHLLFFLGLL